MNCIGQTIITVWKKRNSWQLNQIVCLVLFAISHSASESEPILAEHVWDRPDRYRRRYIFQSLDFFGYIFTVRLRSIRTVLLSKFYPSVRLSVKREYYDKTKALSENSSVMTNRKLPTTFPMSLRWTSYVAPNPQRGLKGDNFVVSV